MPKQRRVYGRNGQLRPDEFPEVMGMAEVVAESGRTAPNAVNYLIDTRPDFPKPIATLGLGPVFIASEIREFFATNRPQRRFSVEEVKEIEQLTQGPHPVSDQVLATEYGVTPQAIGAIRRGTRKGRKT